MDSAAPSRWSRLRKSVFRLLGFALLLYVGIILGAMFFEDRLVFIPTRANERWLAVPASYFQDLDLVGVNDTKLHAWWCPYDGSDHAVLYLHGNGGNLSYSRQSVQDLHDSLKVNVLIVDYPGYGKSEGTPSEKGCYSAADAGYDWLVKKKKIEPKRIILFGESLGGGVVVNLGSRKEHEAIVLVKTFTSVPDVGQRVSLAAGPLVRRNRFNSLEKIGFCSGPIFVASSPDDEMIPDGLGKKLFDAANEPKKFFTLRGGHNDGLPKEFYDSLKTFLLTHN